VVQKADQAVELMAAVVEELLPAEELEMLHLMLDPLVETVVRQVLQDLLE
jgi:hypothetical protein